jgi:elongation factor 1-alpha
MTSEQEILEILQIGETQNAEFKQRLTKADLKQDRRQKLVTRIRYMTCDSPFEGRFLLGIEDVSGREWKVSGLTESKLKTAERVLLEICEEADVEIIEEERIETSQGLVGVYLLKRTAAPEVKETCSINVAGRVNSGKSTLIGALVTGHPDNGSGRARAFLLKHPQEITRGQTADIHLAFMGFSEDGKCIHLENPLSKEESARVLDQSAKILTFFDAPGHEEYSKTMIRSILGADAQYGLVLIPVPEEFKLIRSEENKTGIRRLDDITREHMILMASQDAPLIVVTSKMDKAKPEEEMLVTEVIRSTLKEIGRIPVNITEPADIQPLVNRAYIDKVYRGIRGTNVVVTGTVNSGVFKKGQSVMLGPIENGDFVDGRLFSIEMFKKRVRALRSGDLFGFDIKDVDKHLVRRGQVVADPDDTIVSCRVFEANIVVTRHPTRITVGYAPVFQSHTIQHTVILQKIYDADYLCVGDFARVRLEFMSHPEAVQIGDKIVLREANTRAIGTIVETIN